MFKFLFISKTPYYLYALSRGGKKKKTIRWERSFDSFALFASYQVFFLCIDGNWHRAFTITSHLFSHWRCYLLNKGNQASSYSEHEGWKILSKERIGSRKWWWGVNDWLAEGVNSWSHLLKTQNDVWKSNSFEERSSLPFSLYFLVGVRCLLLLTTLKELQ